MQLTNFGEFLQGLQKEERAKGGVLDMDTEDCFWSITSHKPGYIE